MLPDFLVGLTADRRELIGILSAVLGIIAFLPYVIDTARGRTQPERATWLIWSVLSSISLASLIAEGATASLWFAVGQVAGTVVIFVLSISKGSGRYFCKRNSLILALAACGLVAWFLTTQAIYALMISIGVSLIAGVPTVIKAYRQPQSETFVTWMVAAVASVLAILSVGSFEPVLLAYPVYLLALYSGILGAVLLRRLSDKEHGVETSVWRTSRVQERPEPQSFQHAGRKTRPAL